MPGTAPSTNIISLILTTVKYDHPHLYMMKPKLKSSTYMPSTEPVIPFKFLLNGKKKKNPTNTTFNLYEEPLLIRP